jgi:hypothetical protein
MHTYIQACCSSLAKEIESLADQFVEMKETAMKVTKREKVPVHLVHKPHVGVVPEMVSLCVLCICMYVLYVHLLHKSHVGIVPEMVSLCVRMYNMYMYAYTYAPHIYTNKFYIHV